MRESIETIVEIVQKNEKNTRNSWRVAVTQIPVKCFQQIMLEKKLVRSKIMIITILYDGLHDTLLFQIYQFSF